VIKKVAVLLATYHPTIFIKEQIESLKSQSGVEIKIYWGDDGSSDAELDLIRECLLGTDYVSFAFNHVGASQNFINLMKVAQNHDYYAFCDQDDVWSPERLISGINSIRDIPTPALAHSSVIALRQGEKRLRMLSCSDHSMKNLLAENCFQGCTLLFNSAARSLFLSQPTHEIVWHDWWMGWLISTCGSVKTLLQPLVLYRIHQNNSIGIPSPSEKLLRLIKRDPGVVINQVQIFKRNFELVIKDDANCEIKRWLELYRGNGLKRAFKMLLDTRRRSSYFDDVLRRISTSIKAP
jgi:glycosyltransferase involved in cell wall biosynthesis